MKRVYLVRHGETPYNKEGLVQDGTIPLSEEGQKQALKIAERLTGLDFQHLVVSDYERTKQTAEPVEKLTGIKPQYSKLFREVRRPSEFWHKPYTNEEFQAFLNTEREKFVSDPSWRHSDGENFVDVADRAHKAFAFLKNLEGDVVVISHGHFIRHLIAQVIVNLELNGKIWQKTSYNLWTTNTGISTLTYDSENDRWRLITFNDFAHFADN